ncbi:TetR/AcrR family transcriptional regulator [Streptomyces sp. NPDC056390]|uniref:TetR/AcrR family transcriptional regulator n=1 Tax=Streptomyces sp. NPDC056390 TaxID=3345806 RepID=UPI0035E051D2
MAPTEQRTASRPGGRSARVLAAVHQAATELICERGPENVSIPAIATRAGVNPTSIYRRWGDVHQLLAAVAESRLAPESLPEDTGSLREDLAVWAEELLDHISSTEGYASLRTVINATADGEVRHRCLSKRADQVDLILGRAKARGESGPTTAQVMDRILALLHFRVLFGVEPTDSAYARGLVDELLAASPATECAR